MRFACGWLSRNAPTQPIWHDEVAEALRELVRHRERLRQDFDDRVRQLHRFVDLGFREFTRYVRSLNITLVTCLLAAYSTAQALARATPRQVAKMQLVQAARPLSVNTTGPSTSCRPFTSARISTSSVNASPTSSAISRIYSKPTRSVSCSPQSTASDRNPPPASWQPLATRRASEAQTRWLPTSASSWA
jgi:hypothetical protein